MAENGFICPTCGKEWSQGRFCPDDGGELEAIVQPTPPAATECFDALDIIEMDKASLGQKEESPQAVPATPETAPAASPRKAASPKLQMEWPALRESRIQAALAEQKAGDKREAKADDLDATAFQQSPPKTAEPSKQLDSKGSRAKQYTHDDAAATVMETPAIRPAGSTSARMYAKARQGNRDAKPDTVETVIDTPALSTEVILDLGLDGEPVVAEDFPAEVVSVGMAETEAVMQTAKVPAPEPANRDDEAVEDSPQPRPWWSRLMFWRGPDWSDFE